MARLLGMSQPSVLYQLIESRLDGTLAEYIAENRAAKSWRAMAVDLQGLTGVAVSDETLRLWFADRIQVVVSDPAGAA